MWSHVVPCPMRSYFHWAMRVGIHDLKKCPCASWPHNNFCDVLHLLEQRILIHRGCLQQGAKDVETEGKPCACDPKQSKWFTKSQRLDWMIWASKICSSTSCISHPYPHITTSSQHFTSFYIPSRKDSGITPHSPCPKTPGGFPSTGQRKSTRILRMALALHNVTMIFTRFDPSWMVQMYPK